MVIAREIGRDKPFIIATNRLKICEGAHSMFVTKELKVIHHGVDGDARRMTNPSRFFTLIVLICVVGCAHPQLGLDTTKWYALNPFNDGGWCARDSQVNAGGGVLTLTASQATTNCNGSNTNYNIGMVVTPNFYFQYGTVKVRSKLSPSGVHSAIWMWGGAKSSTGYPPTCIKALKSDSGHYMGICTATPTDAFEVDIAELLPALDGVNTIRNNVFQWNNGVLSDPPGGGLSNVNLGYDVTAASHVFELDWTSSGLVYKTDGVATTSYSFDPAVPMFLILDQEIDAAGGTGRYPINTYHYSVEVTCVAGSLVNGSPCSPGEIAFQDNFRGVSTAPTLLQ